MEEQLLGLYDRILTVGKRQINQRTGTASIMLDGATLEFDVSDGKVMVPTTRQIFTKGIFGELVGFLKGVESAADFRALGCNFWDDNANVSEGWLKNAWRKGVDDLGPIYGAQWRRWKAYKHLRMSALNTGVDGIDPVMDAGVKAAYRDGWQILTQHQVNESFEDAEKLGSNPTLASGQYVILTKEIDQLGECIRKLVMNPSDRRILFHGWNPAELDAVALPACHVMYQFIPTIETRELTLVMTIRSWDTVLGAPANILSGTALLNLIARLTAFKPKKLIINSGDTHIYEQHVESLTTIQMKRTPYPAPVFRFNGKVPNGEGYLLKDWEHEDGTKSPATDEDKLFWAGACAKALDIQIEPSNFAIENYEYHPKIKYDMVA